MDRVLIGIVGENPASILVAARALRPQRALLLCTDETRDVAARLVTQLSRDPAIRADTIECPANPTLQQSAEAARTLDLAGATPMLDITGGTKPMLLGVWEALRGMRGAPPDAYYLDRDHGLLQAELGDRVPGSVVIEPEEFLAWNRISPRDMRSSGPLQDLAAAANARQPLAQALVDLVARGADYGYDKPARGQNPINRIDITKPEGARLRTLADGVLGFSVDGSWLMGPLDWFSRHQWLESWCLVEAAAAVSHRTDVRAAFSLAVSAGRARDESDVVLTRGHRIVVVEAKARADSERSGELLHARVQKTRHNFCDLASVIFVQPSWGPTPSAELQDAVEPRTVALVGSDRVAYRQAVRRLLGIE